MTDLYDHGIATTPHPRTVPTLCYLISRRGGKWLRCEECGLDHEVPADVRALDYRDAHIRTCEKENP